jgi:hypothetical protein
MSDSTSASASGAHGHSPMYEWPSSDLMIPIWEASVILAFHGLMCLAYHRDRYCLEAGMHSKAAHHKFKMHVVRFAGNLGKPIETYSFEPDSYDDVPDKLITVDISRPLDPGVKCYLPHEENDLSWSQCLDLEGPELHKGKMKKKKGVLKPKVTVNHGMFYVIPTEKEFLRFEEKVPGGTNIGRIAYLGLGLVRHAHIGTVKIITKREKLTLRCSKYNPLLIYFSNACPRHWCPSNQNDFPEYYKVISAKKKFRLEPVPDPATPLDLRSLSFVENLYAIEPFASTLSSMDAPCGFAGFGRSRGIDDGT